MHIKYKTSTIRLLRAASQVLFFILLPALFTGSFSGIKQIYLSGIHQSFSFTAMLPQVVEAAAIIPITILAGRFFCGWMCAFGTTGDFLYMLSSKLLKRRYRIGEKADRALKFVKYIVLAFLVLAVWTLDINTFVNYSPWDAFGMLFTVGQTPDLSYVAANMAPALFILIFIIIASFFVERFFCRYLCPLGAIFSIVSKLRITNILKSKTKCGSCRMCADSCPMGISIYKKDASKSGECINCFNCVAACPRKNVSLAVSQKDVRPILTGMLMVGVMTGLYYTGSLASNALGVNPATVQAGSGTASNKIYSDGTYTGTGTGFRGAQTTVSVTVKNDKIAAVDIISYGDDAPFFNRAYPTVVQSIIDQQSTDVDVVSGATFSSDGIIQAVEDALSKARIQGEYSSDSSNTAAQDGSQSSSFSSDSSVSDMTPPGSSSSNYDTYNEFNDFEEGFRGHSYDKQ